jgi:ElaB/YqjD/DUF883 family membrane-anchored ribosome-binding protein
MSTRTTSFEPSLGAKVSETATQVQDKVSELGRTAADKIEESRAAAANKLRNTASNAKGVMTDIQGAIRRNPAPMVLAAGVIGFLAGRALTMRDRRRRRAVQQAKAALIAAAATHFKEISAVLFPRIRELSQRAVQKARA